MILILTIIGAAITAWHIGRALMDPQLELDEGWWLGPFTAFAVATLLWVLT